MMEIRKLNTLRGLAALIVVVSHYSNITLFGQGLFGFGAGQFGVMLFFMLSGFLMSYLYMGQEFIYHRVYHYIVARVARVIPLFLLVVLISYGLINIAVFGILYNITNIYQFLAHLFFLFGTSVLWTIPAEVQFYILFVFLWWLYQKKGIFLFVFISFIIMLLIFINFPNIKTTIYQIPLNIDLIRVLPYFLMGIVFGRAYSHIKHKDLVNCQSHFYVILLLVIPLLYPKNFSFIFNHKHDMWQDMNVLFVMSFIFFMTVFLVPKNNFILENRLGDFFGKISYSLYLLHEPVLWQLKPYAVSSPNLFLIIFIFLSTMLAFLVYLFIELPMRTKIRSWAL